MLGLFVVYDSSFVDQLEAHLKSFKSSNPNFRYHAAEDQKECQSECRQLRDFIANNILPEERRGKKSKIRVVRFHKDSEQNAYQAFLDWLRTPTNRRNATEVSIWIDQYSLSRPTKKIWDSFFSQNPNWRWEFQSKDASSSIARRIAIIDYILHFEMK